MATNAILGGAQAQLSQADILSSRGIMGNVYGPGGGFKDSPLAGSQVKTKSNLEVTTAQSGQPDPPKALSDFAIVKTTAPVSVAVIAAVSNIDVLNNINIGGGDSSGDGGGPGGGGGGGGGDGGDGGE